MIKTQAEAWSPSAPGGFWSSGFSLRPLSKSKLKLDLHLLKPKLKLGRQF